jgi:hypothetical protein
MQDEFGIVFVCSPSSATYKMVKPFATRAAIVFSLYQIEPGTGRSG